MQINLQIPEDDVRTFLELAGAALQASRSETAFGAQISKHLFYTGFRTGSGTIPAIVTLSIRRVRGREQVLLSEVRRLDARELTQIGLDQQPEWTSEFLRQAKQLVVAALRQARDALVSGPNVQQYFRGILAYHGAAIAGEYWLDGWRIGPAHDPNDTLVGQRILLCDRVVTAPTKSQVASRFQADLGELADFLTVFWMSHVYALETGFAWVIEDTEVDGEHKFANRIARTGYIDSSRPQSMPLPGELDQPGETSAGDRMDPLSWGTRLGEPFKPPSDAAALFHLFARADSATALRFRQAAKAYAMSEAIAVTTVTGAIAYLVVAAESLSDAELPQCPCCHQVRGISQRTRQFFFEELPCLREREAEVAQLLNRVYDVRSRHFHDALFLSGELSPPNRIEILMPTSMEMGMVRTTLRALVNSLLVAWLTRRVTGDTWPRAVQPPPQRREPRYFSATVRLGGPPTN